MMNSKKIEDYEEMLKICGDFMHHQNEYIKKLESQLITSRESQSAVPSEDSLKTNFHNGHYPANNGAKYALCEYCGMAQNYWDKFECSRIELIKRGIAK